MIHSLGKRIRELRLKKGITQIELANGIVSASMISQIEAGKAHPSHKVLFRIATKLDVSLESLIKDINLDLEQVSQYKMAIGFIKFGQYSSAIPLIENLVDAPRSNHFSLEELRYYLGVCFLNTGDYDRALLMFEKGTDNAKFKGDNDLAAKVMMGVALVYKGQRNLQVAHFQMERAIAFYQNVEQPDPATLGKLWSELANIKIELGQVDQATELYERALQQYEKCNDLEQMGKTFFTLAESAYQTQQYERSTEYATQALAIFNTLEHKDETNQVQRQLIMIQRTVNWQESVKRLSEIAAQFERRDKSKAGEIYLDIAQICLENGETEEAWAFAEKAMLQLSPFDKSNGRAHYLLAQIHDAYGDKEKAKTQCEKAIQVFKNFESISELHPIVQFMSTLLQKHGEFEESMRVRESFYSYMLQQLGERGIAV